MCQEAEKVRRYNPHYRSASGKSLASTCSEASTAQVMQVVTMWQLISYSVLHAIVCFVRLVFKYILCICVHVDTNFVKCIFLITLIMR